MFRYVLKRLGYYVVLVFVATSLTYVLSSATMDPRNNFAGRNPAPPAAVVDQQLTQLGVNDQTPLAERYGTWLGHAVRGDLGRTIDNRSINAQMGAKIVVSLRLLVLGTIIGTVLGVALGAWNAVRQYKFSDRLSAVFSFVVMAMPTFVLAVLMKIGAITTNNALGHQVFLFSGESTPGLHAGFFGTLLDQANHLLLPTLVLVLISVASYSRYQRSTMLDVLGAEYLRTARAKGVPRRQALLRHGLRTALIPMATLFSYGFLSVFTGAFFLESIFGWNGIGSWFIQAVQKNDINTVTAVSLFSAVVILLAGFLADVLHAALDPRIRTS